MGKRIEEIIKKLKSMDPKERNLIIKIATYGDIYGDALQDSIEFYLDEFKSIGVDDPDQFINENIALIKDVDTWAAKMIIEFIAMIARR